MKKIFEALKLQHDSEKNVLIIVSDQTDDRLNKEETYKNRNLFKEKGFKWNGTNWQIPSDQFEEAKKVITIANKTNYFIDKLEDVEAAVSSTNEPASALISGKITQFIEQLANETDEAAASEQIQRYLNFFANFKQYRYSFNNRILIYIQKPDAKHVDSFKGWKEKNRVVKKGAKGLKILVPIFKKENNPIVNKDAENPRPLGFRIGNVFDVSDTMPMNEQGEIPEAPKWWGDETPEETVDHLFELVKSAATSDGIDITTNAAKHGEHGYSSGGHINITSDIEGAARLATMVHEYAHELMHWDGKSKYFAGEIATKSRGLMELQAESVSYVVMRNFEIPVTHQSTYLALWKANSEQIRNNMDIISKVSQHIINMVNKQAGHDAPVENDVVESLMQDMTNIITEQYRMMELAGMRI